MAQTSLIYAAALSSDICSSGYYIMKFSDGIMAAVSLPITAKLHDVMEEISLKRSENVPIGALATAAVKVLLTFLTSLKVNSWLAAVALLALMGWLISDGQAGDPATWCIAWVLHFALMSAIDINRKGGEL